MVHCALLNVYLTNSAALGDDIGIAFRVMQTLHAPPHILLVTAGGMLLFLLLLITAVLWLVFRVGVTTERVSIVRIRLPYECDRTRIHTREHLCQCSNDKRAFITARDPNRCGNLMLLVGVNDALVKAVEGKSVCLCVRGIWCLCIFVVSQ